MQLQLSPEELEQAAVPSLWRRLAAIGYDCLMLSALLVLATALVVLSLGLGLGYQLPDGDPLLQLYLLLITFSFFAGFWTHGGQTIGMRAWRIRVIGQDGRPLSWPQATIRFLAAIFSWLVAGLGFWWILLDANGLAWHDHLSKSRLILLKKQTRSKH